MIEIDGSYGSGGGAVLRTAVGLSLVTGKPVKVFNIRKNRPQGGLRTQHLEGIKSAAEFCSARLKGAELDSTEVEFHPGEITKTGLSIKIGTAGSIGLVFQTLQLAGCAIKQPLTVGVHGGATFGKFAPPLLYTKNILLSVLNKMGYSADISIERHGFFPVGGAEVAIQINPAKELRPLVLKDTGKITHLGGLSVADSSLQKARVAERQARETEAYLKSRGYSPLIKEMYAESSCPGSGIVLWASDGSNVLGADALGERGKKAEDVGREAAVQLLETINSKSSVDSHLSDQLLAFMALAKGRSSITAPRLSSHAKTNIWVIQKFLDVEFVTTEKQKNVVIECSGSK